MYAANIGLICDFSDSQIPVLPRMIPGCRARSVPKNLLLWYNKIKSSYLIYKVPISLACIYLLPLASFILARWIHFMSFKLIQFSSLSNVSFFRGFSYNLSVLCILKSVQKLHGDISTFIPNCCLKYYHF